MCIRDRLQTPKRVHFVMIKVGAATRTSSHSPSVIMEDLLSKKKMAEILNLIEGNAQQQLGLRCTGELQQSPRNQARPVP
eukprot:5725340-Prorocentrum_lima.AAC.1